MSPNTISALMSGALTGAGVGAVGSLSEAKKLREILIAALKGGAVSSALAGGSTALGESLLGEADENDLGGHTNRGALGGALGGGTVGAGLGAVAGSIPFKTKVATDVLKDGAKAGKIAEEASPFAVRAFKSLAHSGSKGALVGGALGALGLGGAAAYLGADEGMQLDYLSALKRNDEDERRRQMAMQQGGYP